MSNVLEFKLREVTDTNHVSVTPAVVSSFEQAKLLRDTTVDIELSDVSAVDKILTTLSLEEGRVFVEVVQLYDELEEYARLAAARQLEVQAGLIRNNVDTADGMYLNAEESQHFHMLKAKHDYLSALLWLSVRSRTDSYNTVLTVKAGLKVVIIGYKYPNDAT